MKKISPAVVALLSIITLGIYGVYYFQTFATEAKRTEKVNVSSAYRANIALYLLSLVSLAALIAFIVKGDNVLIISLAASFAAFRIADAIVLGVNFNSLLAQISNYFKIEYKNATAAYIILSVVLPFITLAMVQTAFNKVEAKAQAVEAGKARI